MADVSPFFVATLSEKVLPAISDQIIKFCPLLQQAKMKKAFQFKKGGASIEFFIRKSASAIGGTTTDYGQRTAKTTNPYASLIVQWRQFDWRIMTSKFQQKRNMNASDRSRNFNSEAQQLKELYQSATERICNSIWGNGVALDGNDLGPQIDGVQVINPTANNTYATVDRTLAANAFFRNQQLTVTNFDLDDNGNGVPNGVEKMKTLWNNCSVGKQAGDQQNDALAQARAVPHLTLTDQTNYEKYENSLMGQYQYVGDEADSIKKLAFHQAPIDFDTFCPANQLHMFNFDHWRIWTTEDDSSLLSVYGEEVQGVLKILTIATQLQQYCDKPSCNGVLAIS